jgi:hypothetical protein
MGLRVISIVNRSRESNDSVQRVIVGINQQIRQDFAPIWNIEAQVELWPGRVNEPDPARDTFGQAVLYLYDEAQQPGMLGAHEWTASGRAFGYCYLDLSRALGEEWSTTLSHEVLEMLADANCNLYALGPHPKKRGKAFHWLEMCDACQGITYEIGGIEVADFVTPHYFTEGDEPHKRTHFRGVTRDGTPDLRSFGVAPGGYIGFVGMDGKTDTHFADARAREVYEIKGAFGVGRRGERRIVAAADLGE